MTATAEVMTMNAAGAMIPAHDLLGTLFDDFISFVDRSQQTARTYITNLRQFAAWLQYRAIRRPERRDVIAYRDYLSAEHEAIMLDANSPAGWTYRTNAAGNRYTVICKPSTVKQYLQSVRQFFTWTASNNLYPNIAANIHPPKVRQDTHRKEALTAADVLTIERDITEAATIRTQTAAEQRKDTAGRVNRATEQGKRLYAMYLLAVNAGLRTIELSRANVKDLEVKNGQAVLYIWGKGHTEADSKKPLAPEVYAAIKDYLDSRSDRPTANSPLFVSTGNRSGGQRIATTTISTLLKRAMQHAGYDSEKITAHSLRHTTAQAALKTSGRNIYTAQKYLRHESPATTEIYLHEDEETERALMETAQSIYDYYHGTQREDSNRAKLESILQRMTADQVAQLAGIAQAIAG